VDHRIATRRGSRGPRGSCALERRLIRPEVIPWEMPVQAASWQAAQDRGLVRVGGKDYIVPDDDVMLMHFAL